MAAHKFKATGWFTVEIDESKLTEEFLTEFSSYMWPATEPRDIIEWLGNLYARGVIDGSDTFIEGLGKPAEFGLKFIGARGSNHWADNHVEIEKDEGF